MKQNNTNLLIAIGLLAIPFAYAAYVYPSLPHTIPTHFNINGEADGFGTKDTIFLGPGIMAVVGIFIYLLLSNIKSIDPKKFKDQDDGMFKKFALLMVGFLSILGFIITFSATNPSINITKLLLPFMGIAFSAMGWYMPKLQQNYFAGFKLPWTLENVANWKATHQMASKVWIYGGVFQTVAGIALSSKWAFICFMGATAIMVIIPIVFSYRMFKRGNLL